MDEMQFNAINNLNNQIGNLHSLLSLMGCCNDNLSLSSSTRYYSMKGTSFETSKTDIQEIMLSGESIGANSYSTIYDALKEIIKKEIAQKEAEFKEIEIPSVPGYEK